VAKGTFAPLLAGPKFFYINTRDYGWALLTKKSSQATPEAVARCPQPKVVIPQSAHRHTLRDEKRLVYFISR